MSYLPLRGIRVLDLGILIPPALTGAKLVALGADVVKVEQRGVGDRIRQVPPFGPDGQSPQHMGQNWGKRSIALDTRDGADRELIVQLAGRADVILENQLVGSWQRMGIDFAEMRRRRPQLIVCSITGFGQTGPLASLPSHGLNMDALADTLNVDRHDGYPKIGWSFTSWGNELGSTYAALAICAAIVNVRGGGEGAWIDLSCWDTLVEAHRTELAMNQRLAPDGPPYNGHDSNLGPLYNTYLTSDGNVVLLAALEPKFWRRFCDRVGRPDLIDRHSGGAIEFGEDDEDLRRELSGIFATATADEWNQRFVDWDVPGSKVLQVPDVIQQPHFAARRIVEGEPGSWPNITSAIRWHHVDERAGSGLAPPPELGADRDSIIADWLDGDV
jgi:crotonobetainyl-CoA:carnitine CoA-transferase CaiB-like acyl-CoA transferase